MYKHAQYPDDDDDDLVINTYQSLFSHLVGMDFLKGDTRIHITLSGKENDDPFSSFYIVPPHFLPTFD